MVFQSEAQAKNVSIELGPRVYSLSVLFGLFHGLVFLPVLLNIAGGGGNSEQPVSLGEKNNWRLIGKTCGKWALGCVYQGG